MRVDRRIGSEYATCTVEGEIFKSRKKKSQIQKYPDTCERGLRSLSRTGNHKQTNENRTNLCKNLDGWEMGFNQFSPPPPFLSETSSAKA